MSTKLRHHVLPRSAGTQEQSPTSSLRSRKNRFFFVPAGNQHFGLQTNLFSVEMLQTDQNQLQELEQKSFPVRGKGLQTRKKLFFLIYLLLSSHNFTFVVLIVQFLLRLFSELWLGSCTSVVLVKTLLNREIMAKCCTLDGRYLDVSLANKKPCLSTHFKILRHI